jgi:ribosomal protein S18 acetylase RimI-like enzyme
MLSRVGAVLDRTISVRRKAAEDEPFIERLSLQAFGDFHKNAGPHTLKLTHHPESVTRLAVRGAQRLGFVVLELMRDAAWIQAIAVVASERGRGVGARLMAEAVRLARESGAARVRLTTAQANVEALELFLKCGFGIERRVPRYYARGQDACILARAL